MNSGLAKTAAKVNLRERFIKGAMTGLLIVWMSGYSMADAPSQSTGTELKLNTKELNLSHLKKELKVELITIKNMPVYPYKNMQFNAFSMQAILKKYFSLDNKSRHENHYLIFETTDGFQPRIPVEIFFKSQNAYLAFQQSPLQKKQGPATRNQRWTVIHAHGNKYDPSPYYLIWKNNKNYPLYWPFKVVSIQLIRP